MNKTIPVILIVVTCIFGPIAIIWSLNTLFDLSIIYTLKTWGAALILSASVKGFK